jgi:hypothetical protein
MEDLMQKSFQVAVYEWALRRIVLLENDVRIVDEDEDGWEVWQKELAEFEVGSKGSFHSFV